MNAVIIPNVKDIITPCQSPSEIGNSRTHIIIYGYSSIA